VGARRLRQKVGAENCEDRRSARRQGFLEEKAICDGKHILPRLSALSLRPFSNGHTKL